ncbi:hypothetical protein AAG906_021681 [Vitis piasezkii]
MSDEWALHKLSQINIGRDIEKLMFDHPYWDRVKHVSYFEPLYVVLRIMDLEVVPTMPFVYKLMQVMKENLIRQQVGDWIFKILKDSWEKTLKHSLHATVLNFHQFDPNLIQAIHDIFAKLDSNVESIGQFGNEKMIELLRKITLIFLTFQPRWVKKKRINYSNGSNLYIEMMKMVILIYELLLMLENLELMLNVCCPKKFTVKVLAKIPRIHFKGH